MKYLGLQVKGGFCSPMSSHRFACGYCENSLMHGVRIQRHTKTQVVKYFLQAEFLCQRHHCTTGQHYGEVEKYG